MMLAVTTATGRLACVRVLPEGEQRRNHWKRESREKQDGEQASHQETGRFQFTASIAAGHGVIPYVSRRFE